jgi:hypothetical protein
VQQLNSKSSRKRGFILTTVGYRKLHQAKLNQEIKQGTRYTLDLLSQQTGLTANTLSKIFCRSVAVDKRSLYACFFAFNLDLDAQDYLPVFTNNGRHLLHKEPMLYP